VSGGHDDRGAEGASIEAPNVPSAVGYGEGVRSPAEGLGERRELPGPAGSGAEPQPLSHFLHILGRVRFL